MFLIVCSLWGCPMAEELDTSTMSSRDKLYCHASPPPQRLPTHQTKAPTTPIHP